MTQSLTLYAAGIRATGFRTTAIRALSVRTASVADVNRGGVPAATRRCAVGQVVRS
jgi:hypothetical protein